MQDKNNSKTNFSQNFIEKLKELFEIKRDSDLAKIIEISGSTLATWKNRDCIDLRIILRKITIMQFNEVYSKALTEKEAVMFSKLRVAEEEVKYEQRSLLELQKQENAALKETVDILQSELLILQKEQNELLKELNQLLKTR